MRRRRVVVLVAALLAAALPASTGARPPRRMSPSTGAGSVAALIEEWRFEEAQVELGKLLAGAPDQPSTLYLDAMMRFQRGDYDGAGDRVEELRERHSGVRGESEAWRDFADLIEGTRTATRGFAEARSEGGHFIIRYQPGQDELLLPYAFETLEAARREIGEKDFDAAALLATPVRVEIYPELADLAKVSTLTVREIETSGTIAVCKFNKLMITSPRALVHGYPWLDTLAHEFTHYVITRVSHNSVPIWLHEGLAKYEERRWRMPDPHGAEGSLSPTMEHLLASALQRGRRLITFEEMSPSMAKLPSQEDTALAFAEVYTVVEYLLAKKGWDGVRGVVNALRDGSGDAAAVSQVMGQPFDEFQRSWRGWLRGRKLRVHAGLVPASLKFARQGAKGRRGQPASLDKDADDVPDADEIAEERVRKLVRLGGMLRARNKLAGAVVEYEKAQQLVGPGHVVVARKLAHALLALGDADGAIAAATPAWERYPDQGGTAALLGAAWQKKGDADKAIGYFEAALRSNPFDPAPHCALATFYDGKRDPRAAREHKACSALQE